MLIREQFELEHEEDGNNGDEDNAEEEPINITEILKKTKFSMKFGSFKMIKKKTTFGTT